MIDPCESCSVPPHKIWLHERCLDCWANEQNYKRPSVNPCLSCPDFMDSHPFSCASCPVLASPDDIFANDLLQMSWSDYLAEKANEREELL